ncbi:MAG: hypothetical protein ACI9D5_001495 [Candidatus Endobugula sp.]|jgi:hypothetical protein
MTDTHSSSAEAFLDDVFLDVIIGNNASITKSIKNKTFDCRRRLEDRLEQRSLEKDVREFNFD